MKSKEKVQPKKSLGQNFLKDPKILQKIVSASNISKNDVVLEIGPGEGALTKLLLREARRVVCVEKDNNLAKNLKEIFKKEIDNKKIEIINEDILAYNLEFTDYIIVGNIPYYITGALFRKIFESKNLPKSVTFVVQKEVAERIIGLPSHKATSTKTKNQKESILSISIKAYGEPYFGGIIKAGSFFPKPKVDSAIISIRNISRNNFQIPEQKFFEILKTGFAHKRKLLIKNLDKITTKRELENVFEKLNINKKIRAEDLNLFDWFNLAKNL